MQMAFRSSGTSGAISAGGQRVGFAFSAKHVVERAIERHAPGERLVERDAHAVPVVAFGWQRPRAVAPAPGTPACPAMLSPMAGVVGNDVARKTEIENHDAPFGCDQDVGRLDVPMKLASVVQRAKPCRRAAGRRA